MANVQTLDPDASPLAHYGGELRRRREAQKLTQPQLGDIMLGVGRHVVGRGGVQGRGTGMSTRDEDDRTETACRICGHDDGEPVFDEYGVPRYVICPCCYNESGIGDDTVSQVRELRGYWVGNGASWHDPKLRPDDWDPLRQLANIPPRWR